VELKLRPGPDVIVGFMVSAVRLVELGRLQDLLLDVGLGLA